MGKTLIVDQKKLVRFQLLSLSTRTNRSKYDKIKPLFEQLLKLIIRISVIFNFNRAVSIRKAR